MRVASDERPGLLHEFAVLETWTARLRGLLGTDEGACPVLLARCRSIHTWGMGYAIDAAFVGGLGEVLLVVRGLAPGSRASCARANCVFERPAREGPWLEEGEHLWIVSASVGDDAAGMGT